MPYTNVHRGARISPTKVRPVMDLIRSKPIDQADSILRMCKRRAAVYILRALDAARENARSAGDLTSDQMRRLVVWIHRAVAPWMIGRVHMTEFASLILNIRRPKPTSTSLRLV